ncbi:carboxypeptidase-like regulatory domain-containing protein [Larkinella arboricola]
MAFINLSIFSVLVVRPGGAALAGARIRVLNPTGSDITLSFLAKDEVYTDMFGKVQRLRAPNSVPAGVYTIEATAPGFKRTTVQTEASFSGVGIFVLYPELITGLEGYSVEVPPTGYLSPMAPVRLTVTAPVAPDQWQLIQTTFNQYGRTTVSESPVDPVTGESLIPVRNRVNLPARPNLVPDGETFLIDPDFSARITLEFSAITDNGTYETDLEPVELLFANIYPPGATNDLTPYTNASGLAKWITPFKEITVFRGYYADVMVWLPTVEQGDNVKLWRQDFSGAGEPVAYSSPGIPPIHFSDGRVVRVRLRVPEDQQITRSVYFMQVNDETVTEPLTVRYR